MLFLGYIGSTVAAGPGVVGESMAGDLIAFFTVGILCTFYAAPLATLAHVLKTADSSSLHPPLCFMNLINGITWSTYGTFFLMEGVQSMLGIFLYGGDTRRYTRARREALDHVCMQRSLAANALAGLRQEVHYPGH